MSVAASPGGSQRTRYDRIGEGYAQRRKPEPSWARQIHQALGDAKTVVNVGAGTGNYEPDNRRVVAVEPSETMIDQRSVGAAPVIQAVAESLPLADRSFDAATALLTVHHWQDAAKGLSELARVSARQVLTVFEPLVSHGFWLLDYFPEALHLPTERRAANPEMIAQHLDVIDVQVMHVPHDCVDGVAAAYWRRPEAYLDPLVRQSISALALLSAGARDDGTKRLTQDLESGRWSDRWSHLLEETQADFGYRLVITAGR